MRALTTGLNASAANETCVRAYAVQITLRSGDVLRLAETQEPITIGGNPFTPAVMEVASVPLAINSTAAKVDIDLIAEDGGAIDPDSLRVGAFDKASLYLYQIDPSDPAAGAGVMFWGEVGEISSLGNRLVLECIGLLGRSVTKVSERWSTICRYLFGNHLGDDRCPVDSEALGVTTTVLGSSTDVAGELGFPVTVGAVAAADDYFKLGTLKILSGVLEGAIFDIRSWDTDSDTAYLYMPAEGLENGASVRLYPGCSYTPDQVPGCKYWGVFYGYGGEPYFTGADTTSSNVTEAG